MKAKHINNKKLYISLIAIISIALIAAVSCFTIQNSSAYAQDNNKVNSAVPNGEWTDWAQYMPVPQYAGKFRLVEDVIVGSSWTPAWGESWLDLNGHTLTVKNDFSKGSIINVSPGVTLNLCDLTADETGVGEGKLTGGTGTGIQGTMTEGGAVYVGTSGVFNIHSGVISGNTATNGGAVHSAPQSHVTMYGGKVCNNTANYGGAFYCAGGDDPATRGTFDLVGGEISENTAVDDSLLAYPYGGALYFDRTIATLTGGIVKGNKAQNGYGGAVCVQGCGITVYDAQILNNDASYGGAFYGYKPNNSVTLSGDKTKTTTCKVSGNTAYKGSAIMVGGDGTCTINYAEISYNGAGDHGTSSDACGSAIYNQGNLVINDCLISNNSAKLRGGAIVNNNEGNAAVATINGGQIVSNKIENPTSGKNGVGGAIYIYGGRFYINGGEIANNTAEYGGAIGADMPEMQSMLNITGGYIHDNTANNSGGAFYVSGGYNNWYIFGGIIAKNHAKTNGGVADVANHAYLQVNIPADKEETNHISGNDATHFGGAMFVEDNGHFDLISGKITENKAKFGGGVYNLLGEKTWGRTFIKGGKITGNKAQYGAGICNSADYTQYSNGPVTMSGILSAPNYSAYVDYALTIEDGEISYNSSPITGNSSLGAGILNANMLHITGGKIVNNMGEGVLNLDRCVFGGENVQITDNVSDKPLYSQYGNKANFVNYDENYIGFDKGFESANKIGFSLVKYNFTSHALETVKGRLTDGYFLNCGFTNLDDYFVFDGNGGTSPWHQCFGGYYDEPDTDNYEI